MKRNEGTLDRLIRLFIAVFALLGGYLWLFGTLQIVVYVIGVVALVTAATGFCGLYALLKINTNKKSLNKIVTILSILLIVVLWWVFVYVSNFVTKKIFLEDFAVMNDSYKQLLFNTGKEKREESVSYYQKLIPAYEQFQNKYTAYKPLIIKWDNQFDADLLQISELLWSFRIYVYSEDLLEMHKGLEAVRPVFQDIFKRNWFSMLAVTLVDFHDIMEEILDAADVQNVQKIIDTYPLADEKLRAIEDELNDESIQTIRNNLDAIWDMANNNQIHWLSEKWAELKSSFVKVYLKRG